MSYESPASVIVDKDGNLVEVTADGNKYALEVEDVNLGQLMVQALDELKRIRFALEQITEIELDGVDV